MPVIMEKNWLKYYYVLILTSTSEPSSRHSYDPCCYLKKNWIIPACRTTLSGCNWAAWRGCKPPPAWAPWRGSRLSAAASPSSHGAHSYAFQHWVLHLCVAECQHHPLWSSLYLYSCYYIISLPEELPCSSSTVRRRSSPTPPPLSPSGRPGHPWSWDRGRPSPTIVAGQHWFIELFISKPYIQRWN